MKNQIERAEPSRGAPDAEQFLRQQPWAKNVKLEYSYALSGKEIVKLLESYAKLRHVVLLEALRSVRDGDQESDSEGNIVVRFNCTEWQVLIDAINGDHDTTTKGSAAGWLKQRHFFVAGCDKGALVTLEDAEAAIQQAERTCP